MRYLSVCSGIEAATVAWQPLGWQPVGFAEIDKFASAVLKAQYPHVPNHGNFTEIEADAVGPVDLLVGGTPCQSFSIAGLRGGLDDDRGNLALEFCKLAQRIRPRWVVWENVPGVLSMDGGRAFASILGGLAECGYGLAYRVLDAQYVRVDGFARAVPQRRRRVFVVGYLGDWRCAGAVLFEPSRMRRDTPPRREEGKSFTHAVASSIGASGRGFERAGETRGQDSVVAVAHTLNGKGGSGRIDFESETFAIQERARTTPQAIPFSTKDYGNDASHELAPTLRSMAHNESHANGGQLGVAYDMRGREDGAQMEGPHETASIRSSSGGSSRSYVADHYAVRRLTPTECERLQGFPDGYTAVTYRRKKAADGPRYKALGNSMAVNVMRWIGTRIDLCERKIGKS